MKLFFEFALLGAFLAGLIASFVVLTRRKPNNNAYKLALGLTIFGAFFLFWSNGAVGIIGSSQNDANMMYILLILVLFIGAMVVRFQPKGMFRLLNLIAIGQIIIPIVAYSIGMGLNQPGWPWFLTFITMFFATLWFASAFGFRKALAFEVQQSSNVA